METETIRYMDVLPPMIPQRYRDMPESTGHEANLTVVPARFTHHDVYYGIKHRLIYFAIALLFGFGIFGGFYLRNMYLNKSAASKQNPGNYSGLPITDPTDTPPAEGSVNPELEPDGSDTAITEDPTPMPTAAVNPALAPVGNILYPTENLTIVGGGQVCFVEEISGSNTTGIMRRYSLNGKPFTAFEDLSTLCFTPEVGPNTVSFQYRNDQGGESGQIIRNFTYRAR